MGKETFVIVKNTIGVKEVTVCEECSFEDPECMFDDCGNEADHCIGHGMAHICDDHLQNIINAGLSLGKK